MLQLRSIEYQVSVQPRSPETWPKQGVCLLIRAKAYLILTCQRYIKELADRIHSIENKLDSEGGLSHEDISTLFGDRSRVNNAGDESSRKRPYSSISGGEFESPVAQRQSPWTPDSRPIQPATAQLEQASAAYASSTLAPQSAPPKNEGFEKPTTGGDVPMGDFEDTPELDEGVIHE